MSNDIGLGNPTAPTDKNSLRLNTRKEYLAPLPPELEYMRRMQKLQKIIQLEQPLVKTQPAAYPEPFLNQGSLIAGLLGGIATPILLGDMSKLIQGVSMPIGALGGASLYNLLYPYFTGGSPFKQMIPSEEKMLYRG